MIAEVITVTLGAVACYGMHLRSELLRTERDSLTRDAIERVAKLERLDLGKLAPSIADLDARLSRTDDRLAAYAGRAR